MEMEILECDQIATSTTFTAWNVKFKTSLEEKRVKEEEENEDKNWSHVED